MAIQLEELPVDHDVLLPVVPPRPRADRPHLRHQPGLDGLRGLAVGAVLLFHAGFSWAVGGYLGVSLFFTLSGFLITSLLLTEREATGRIDLGAFWARRFRRLMPAALACLAMIVMFGAVIATPEQLRTLRGDVLGALAYVANWRFVFSGQSYAKLFSSPSPVQHFWSLAIEEQFYLFFPLLCAGALAITRRSRKAIGVVFALLALGSTVLMIVLYNPAVDTSRVYYGTDTRAAELLIGALLAVIVAGRTTFRSLVPRAVAVLVGMLALGASIYAWSTTQQNSSWLYRGGFSIYALGSALIILGAMQPGPLKKMLSVRPLCWLGAVSYGVYLYHWPVYRWLTQTRTGLSELPLFGLRLLVTLALAQLSYTLLEVPIRRAKRLTSWRPLVVAPAMATALIVGIIVVTADPPKPAINLAAAASVKGVPLDGPDGPNGPDGPSPQTALASASDTTAPAPPPTTLATALNPPMPTAPPPAPRIPLKPGEKPRVLIVGDSMAMTLGGGIQHYGRNRGVSVWNGGQLGCGIGPGGERKFMWETQTPTENCNNMNSSWAEWVTDNRPHDVLVLSAVWDILERKIPGDTEWRRLGDTVYDHWLLTQMISSIDVLGHQGARVLWATVPPIDIGREVDQPGEFNDPIIVNRLNKLIRQAVAARPGVAQVYDLQGYMDSRPGGDADWEERPDGVHWTIASGNAIGDHIAPELVEIAKQP